MGLTLFRRQEAPVPVATASRRPPRFLVLYLSAFRLERCGYDADEIVGLVDEVKNAARLVALTPGARSEGLRPLMTTAEARAVVPGVRLEPLDAEGEAADRDALLRKLLGLSDQVEALDDDTWVLEIQRTASVFGGEEALLSEARTLLDTLGHRVRCAIADEPLAAQALARFARRDTVVEPGQGAVALRQLPARALSPSSALEDGLRAIGISTIGELARLDSAAVAGRFGEEGSRLHRVARGERISWGLAGDEERQALTAGVVFSRDVTQRSAIEALLPGLLSQLRGQLAAREDVAARLRIRLDLVRGAPTHLNVRIARPTRSPEVMERLIRARLERLTLSAPVQAVHIEVAEPVADPGWQPGLTDRREATEPLPELVARLCDTLGESAIFAAEPVDAWRPEASWRPRNVFDTPLVPEQHRRNEDDPVALMERFEARPAPPRPVLLLPAPKPIEVVADAHERPRLVDGTRVDARQGPEHLQGEWWCESVFDRAYWVVSLEGRTAWIFQEAGRWFLHGWY